VASLALVALLISACSSDPTPTPVPTPTPTTMPTTIVDIAIEDGRFETLVAAVTAADLAGTLSGEGPFTLFAPTDEAFAALPMGTVEGLLQDIPALSKVLLYHVVSGQVPASAVVELTQAETVGGETVSIKVVDGNVFIDEAKVIIRDIQASNGIIHVIDSVLTPSPTPTTIVDIAIEDGRFETLVAAVTAADLAGTLSGEGPFTLFAPTDEAFAALPMGTVEGLLQDIPALSKVLLYHVVSGQVPASAVAELTQAETVGGETVSIKVVDGNVFIDEAKVIIRDIQASNGIIHVIDSVLLP
jgi:transforming growth factor-beta-induced protein